MSGIGIVGNLIVDRYKVVDTYPAAGALTTIRQMRSAGGGLAYNCAVDLARLDADLRIPVVGVVGHDEEGTFLLDSLSQYPQIELDGIHRAGQTSYTDVMEDAGAKTRTFFQYRGANALLDVEHVDFDSLNVDMLHVGYVLLLDSLDQPDEECGTRLAQALKEAQRRGIVTSIDVVSEESDRYAQVVPPALKYTDLCIVNELEAARTTGINAERHGQIHTDQLRQCAEALLNMGVSTWVVIHWRGGAVGLSRDGQWEVAPSVALPREQIATATGAGDAFASGVLLGAWKKLSLRTSIELGIGAAAMSLLDASSTDGVTNWRETLDFYRLADHEEIR